MTLDRWCVLVLLALVADLGAREVEAQEQRIRIQGPIDDVLARDVDGDDHMDLVIVSAGQLSWFRGTQAGTLEAEPALQVPLPAGATVYDLGDLEGDGDQELVTLHTDGLRGHDLDEGRLTPRPRPLIFATTLLRGGETRQPVRRELLRDLSGDGVLDCLVPAARHLRLYQGDGSGRFIAPQDLQIEPEGTLRVEEPWNRDSGQDPTSSFLATVSIPRARPGGDPARPDLLVIREQELRVHRRDADGRLGALPALTFQIPDPPRDDRRRFRAFDLPVLLGDVDGDGATDLVVPDAAGGRVAVHCSRGGSFRDQPDHMVTVSGWLGGAQIEDLDGDGKEDLLLVRLDRLTVWDLLAIITRKQVPVEVSVYLATGEGKLAQRPAFREAVDIALVLGAGRHGFERIEAAFVPAAAGDHTGDGVREIVLLEGRDTLRLVGRQSGGSWQPLGRVRVRGLSSFRSCSVGAADLDGDGRDALLLICHAWEPTEPDELILLRLRP